MVDDEEDLIAKIRKEFGIEDTKKKNYSEVETSDVPYYKEPEERVRYYNNDPYVLNTISDISRDDDELITGEVSSVLTDALNIFYEGRRATSSPEARTPEARTPEPRTPPFERLKSGFTDATGLSTATTTVMGIEDLTLELQKRGLPLPRGRKPTTPSALKVRELYLKAQIKENDKSRGVSP